MHRIILICLFSLAISCATTPEESEANMLTILDVLGEKAADLHDRGFLSLDQEQELQKGILHAIIISDPAGTFSPSRFCPEARERLECINAISRTTREALERAQ